jgi:all-trans-nonaprenyl-diphosphate synthase
VALVPPARPALRTYVYTPVRAEAQTALKLEASLAPANLLGEILAPVAADMEQMNRNLKNVVGNRHPMLMAAAEQIFGAGGKKLRPVIVFLVAHSTAQRAGLP